MHSDAFVRVIVAQELTDRLAKNVGGNEIDQFQPAAFACRDMQICIGCPQNGWQLAEHHQGLRIDDGVVKDC